MQLLVVISVDIVHLVLDLVLENIREVLENKKMQDNIRKL